MVGGCDNYGEESHLVIWIARPENRAWSAFTLVTGFYLGGIFSAGCPMRLWLAHHHLWSADWILVQKECWHSTCMFSLPSFERLNNRSGDTWRTWNLQWQHGGKYCTCDLAVVSKQQNWCNNYWHSFVSLSLQDTLLFECFVFVEVLFFRFLIALE